MSLCWVFSGVEEASVGQGVVVSARFVLVSGRGRNFGVL